MKLNEGIQRILNTSMSQEESRQKSEYRMGDTTHKTATADKIMAASLTGRNAM